MGLCDVLCLDAAGPYAGMVDSLLRGGGGEGGGGRELPLLNEVHAKDDAA